MRSLVRFLSAIGMSTALSVALAAQASSRPADATAQCKDGTYSTASTKKGACSGHGGVKTWYAKPAAKSHGKAAKEETKAAGEATKSAAKDTGAAVKDAAKATGDVTKDAAKSTARKTEEGAKAVGTAAKDAGTAAKDAVTRPSDAPKNATAKCKDGTYSHAKQHRGACANHGGVAEWYQ
jgi:hypothetical protein